MIARCGLLIAIGMSLAMAGVPAAFAAAPITDGKQVPTLTIPIAPDPNDGADESTPSGPVPDAPAQPASADEPVPTVEYDLSKLPAPVKALRDRILAAAKTGDMEQLRPIMQGGSHPPNLGADEGDTKDPIAFLKGISGDPDGREILAILSEVLEAGYVHVDVGTPQELYVWPYFARYPLDKLTPPQLVELFRLLTSSDYDEMKTYGAYLFYRVGITPDGQWSEFQAGD
ncbi:hypothetical protein GGR25_001658 [Kaistia hirudinis]|uniref:Uncharacterized protein n=1 Tax=Kaistia hirudinis TaxID=1293440 RepID=A0A840AJW1_9HYPH|nr:hypothetical protein [Kaistia hirudinis]MBB3930619.1 hypothetical protein [Kaistia hirudinis]